MSKIWPTSETTIHIFKPFIRIWANAQSKSVRKWGIFRRPHNSPKHNSPKHNSPKHNSPKHNSPKTQLTETQLTEKFKKRFSCKKIFKSENILKSEIFFQNMINFIILFLQQRIILIGYFFVKSPKTFNKYIYAW